MRAGPVAVCSEDGIKPADSVKTGGFLDELSDLQLRKDVHTVKLMILTCLVWRFRKTTAKSDFWLRHVCPSASNNWAPTGRIFMKFRTGDFNRNPLTKFMFY